MEVRLRSWNEVFRRFKLPKDDKVFLARLETNLLYYLANYLICILPTFFLLGFLWAVVVALLCVLHAIARPRTLKSKFNLFANKMRTSQNTQAAAEDGY